LGDSCHWKDILIFTISRRKEHTIRGHMGKHQRKKEGGEVKTRLFILVFIGKNR
jgi:hypothetical protein